MSIPLRKRVNRISDDAIEAATSRPWEAWYKLLDKDGARMMEHRDMVQHLQQVHGLSDWWSKLISSAYEEERGMRPQRRKARTYTVNCNRTIAVPAARVWQAWQNPPTLAQWFPGARFTIQKSKPDQSLHLGWPDGSSVAVWLAHRGGKTRVLLSHGKLACAEDVRRMQAHWKEALGRLKNVLEA